ncbi:MAG: 3-keto-5-aminohexanoate cleavage protein [Rhodospirillales bacterium]|nr:3-keto-5-aminohexanoate cleavage protein [Rhodospirillales bacterium]
MQPTIITCAVTGSPPTVGKHPAIPVTPEQIATACIESAKAGAAVAHIHVRDVQTGKPSMDLALYREVVERVRASATDVIVNLTTGPGGRFVPGKEDLKVAGPGTTLASAERRVQHVVDLRPEICSLDFNTMNQSGHVTINWPEVLIKMSNLVREAGTKPELEVFDSGDVRITKELIEAGHIDKPALYQICLGIKYGADQTPEAMRYMRDLLPEGSHWAGFGISRMEFPMVAQAFLLGGNVRVGLEDNIYISRGVFTRDNAQLVERAANMVNWLGGRVATPSEAREILGLKKLAPRAVRSSAAE